jgi:LemA protein
MKKGIIALVAVVAVVLIWGFSGYNHLITLNEAADSQWAKVETQYQRRFDLIPNLVSATKAALTQEQTVFSDIANARAQYSGATTPDEKAAAASQVESSLGRLIAIVENYPQLASSGNIRDLMTELEGTENRVSVERTRFNDEIQAYNTALKRFPTVILATLTGFRERAYFQAAAGAEQAPQVNFE